MKECFKCGISEEETLLFDAISGKGIVKLCRHCSEEESLPMVNQPLNEETVRSKISPAVSSKSEMSENTKKMYDRLSRLSGVNPAEKKSKEEVDILNQDNESLKQIVKNNFESNIKDMFVDNSRFMDNFHWVIMRARRAKHLTQEQLAKEISESVEAVKMAEKAVIPEGNESFVRKLEQFLGVRIFKEFTPTREIKGNLNFEPYTVKNLTISDLQEKKEESNIRKSKSLGEEKELSDEEMNDIIFGSKKEDL